jgi:hypothetical protein
MYRILILVFIMFVPGTIAMFAAEGEAEYQLAWKTGNKLVWGDLFKATPEDASQRQAWADRLDPSTKHMLFQRSAVETRRIRIAEPVDSHSGHEILYGFSVASVLGANGMDIASSYGKQEANPLLRGSNGTFDARSVMLKSALVGGLQVSSYLVTRRRPELRKRVLIMNFVTSAILAGIAVHNFGVR